MKELEDLHIGLLLKKAAYRTCALLVDDPQAYAHNMAMAEAYEDAAEMVENILERKGA